MIDLLIDQPCSVLRHVLHMLHAPLTVLLGAAPALVLSLLLAGALGHGFGVPSLLLWADQRKHALAAGFGTGLTYVASGVCTLLLRTHESDYSAWLEELKLSGTPAPVFALWHVTAFCAELIALAIVAHVIARRVYHLGQKRLHGRSETDRMRDARFASWEPPRHWRSFALGFVGGAALSGGFWSLAAFPSASSFLSWPATWLDGWNHRVMGSRIEREWLSWHGLAAALFVAMVGGLAVWGKFGLRRPPAGLSFCGLLVGICVAVGGIGFNLPVLGVLLLGVSGILLGALPEHRYPFRGPLRPKRNALPESLIWAEAPARLTPATQDPGTGTPIWGEIPLENSGHTMREQGKHPLVIVCASGGGLRAAVWTAHVLRRLEKGPYPLSPHVRLIFGASGGMLGAAHYVHTLLDRQSEGVRSTKFFTRIGRECLSRLVEQYVFVDTPLAYTPCKPGRHRGDEIEKHWAENLGIRRRFTFGELVSHEKKAELPSLVFSPMMLEDGRRLLISNLDLLPLTFAAGHELKPDGAVGMTRFSQSALEASKLFGDMSCLRVLSAVRASASFPFIMPISSLPTIPRRQLVDAGYYDNYGTGLAAAWLGATLDDPLRRSWLLEHCSGVLVIQIRDGVLDLTLPLRARRGPTCRAAEQILGPARAVLGFQTAVQLFENDEDLAAVGARFESERIPFATASFEFGGTAALSWALSREDLRHLAKWARSEHVALRVSKVHAWLARPHRWAEPEPS